MRKDKNLYDAPELEVLVLSVEKGFAVSANPNQNILEDTPNGGSAF